MATAALSAALLLAPILSGLAQAPGQAPAPASAAEKEKILKDKRIAQQFEAQARVLTVFDRQGKVLKTVGERGLYDDPIFSPDQTRLAVNKLDLESETEDLWVLDVVTGKSTRITSHQKRENARGVVWSPDGKQLAYSVFRSGYERLYRRTSNGAGPEELLYQHPGGSMILRDWSQDGRFLAFSTSDLSGGTLYVLPLAGDGERKPTVIFRSEAQLRGSSFSPDSRVLSYSSDQSGKAEIYVQPFESSAALEATAPAARSSQMSDQGAVAWPAFWRADGKEMYYWAANRGLMAVEVDTAAFRFGKPKLLFRLSEAVSVRAGLASVARDGQRIVIAVPHAPILEQITVFDRQRNELRKVGELGRYNQPMLSPDGTRVAVVRTVPQTGVDDIWTLDVTSGKGTSVTNDTWSQDSPVWSPDGKQLAYNSWRGRFASIYRKAWDGTGTEEYLYQEPTPGAGMLLTDWSADGKFLVFQDDCAGVLHVLPLVDDQKPPDRKAMDWLRDEYMVGVGLLSPDSRFMAYLSDEIEAQTFEVYVRPFDATKSDVSAGGEKAVRVSTAGAQGMIFWRRDGRQLYYLTPEWDVMAVDITTTPTLQAGAPRLLLKLPGPVAAVRPYQLSNVSRDGQRFVFTINVPVSISAR